MIKSLKIIHCLIILFLFSNLVVNAETTGLQELLIVCGDENYPPNEMKINGQLVGVHIDLIKEIAAILKIKVVFGRYPWARAVNMLKTGEADAITYFSRNSERGKIHILF